MTDRELLKWAAKAAGITYEIDGFITGTNRNVFNPLTDDGDAFRLAVKLRMDTLPGVNGALAFVSRNHPKRYQAEEPYGDDPYAATRRAIVRAAAEIGKAMP